VLLLGSHVRNASDNGDDVDRGRAMADGHRTAQSTLENRLQDRRNLSRAVLRLQSGFFHIQYPRKRGPRHLMSCSNVNHGPQRILPVIDQAGFLDGPEHARTFLLDQCDRDRILAGKVLIERADTNASMLCDGIR
jgi:hypothetical protein